jgi:hypothetical protein
MELLCLTRMCLPQATQVRMLTNSITAPPIYKSLTPRDINLLMALNLATLPLTLRRRLLRARPFAIAATLILT